MGPAALLDYDRKRLRGLVLEEGGPHSHVAIVARALGIAAVGEIDNATGIADPGDAIIVDGSAGDVHLRPLPDMEAAYAERVRLRARRQQQYQALRDQPCVTKDGEEMTLLINAGLSVDLPHIADTGAAGIGLFRTELQFMVAPNFPRSSEQYTLYRAVLDAADDKPVTFRTLDIGGDKVLPYMRNIDEENPALGWRAIRLGLDRPALLRTQLRALSARRPAAASLKIMFPMIATVAEFEQAKDLGRARADASCAATATSCPIRSRSAAWSRSRRCFISSTNCWITPISFRSARTTSCNSSMRSIAAIRGSPAASIRCRRRCCARSRTSPTNAVSTASR